ncbi:hypothetical protein OBV_05390 [Oscillibacter valericigenes Sjm18-20]|nr:hypothetical protein OBV_05390 [Oscillibacter valericigenes Sjm18-20]
MHLIPNLHGAMENSRAIISDLISRDNSALPSFFNCYESSSYIQDIPGSFLYVS